MKNKLIIILLIFCSILWIQCNNESYPERWETVCSYKNIRDGKYSGYLVPLDKYKRPVPKIDTLYVWVIVKDGKYHSHQGEIIIPN